MTARGLPPLQNRWYGIPEPDPPGRPRRLARWRRIECSVQCRDCGFFGSYPRNGPALASQHARRTGHQISFERTIVGTYNRREKAP
jgi:hypothetical protein